MVRLKHRFIIAQVYFLQRHLQSAATNTTTLSNFGSDVTRVVNSYRIVEAIKQRIHELYGEMGIGDFGQQVVIKYYEQEHSKLLIIKVPRGYQKYVLFALSAINSIEDIPLVIRTLHLSSCTRTTTNKIKELMEIYVIHHSKSVEKEDGERLIESAMKALKEI